MVKIRWDIVGIILIILNLATLLLNAFILFFFFETFEGDITFTLIGVVAAICGLIGGCYLLKSYRAIENFRVKTKEEIV